MPKLKNHRHERFCQEYIKDLKKTEAARRTGYKDNKNLGATAWDLYNQPHIRARIEELLEERKERWSQMVDRVLREYEKLAFVNIADILKVTGQKLTVEDFDKLSDDLKACIKKVKQTRDGITLELYDKVQALTMIGKHLNIFTDVNVDVSGSIDLRKYEEMSEEELSEQIKQALQDLLDDDDDE